MKVSDLKIIWYDEETMREYFLISFLIENQWYEFGINAWKDDTYKLIQFLEDHKDWYFVGFNNINFDAQVLEWIYRNYKNWVNLANLEVCYKIWKFATDTIDDSNHDLKPTYWEGDFTFKQIDLFRIHHMDNENMRTSLKWLEFMMDMPNIEDMPIFHGKQHLNQFEIEETRKYCRNDIEATKMFWYYTIGETEHEEYKGKNEIQYRFDIIDEFKLPDRAINFSNVKIGDELTMLAYCRETGKDKSRVYDLKAKRKPTKKFTYGDCIPSYINFKTAELQKFKTDLSKIKVNLTKKDTFTIDFRNTRYTIAKGGIHSVDKRRIILPNENEKYIDGDIGSQYPNAIVKGEIYPDHLGSSWLVGVKGNIVLRLGYKAKGKKGEKKYEGLAYLFKYALNGGSYGKLGEPRSWQYDIQCMFKCTIANQFEILMLIEMLELEGINVCSANTDGITCLVDLSLEATYYRICEEWEKIVGNYEMGKLEYTEYIKFVQTSVNEYIAIKKDGEIKKKGDFCTDVLLHKNKSRRVVPLALEQYFVNNIPVEETIRNHKNIYDFCIGVKASKDYFYKTINRQNNQTKEYKRLIRYIVTKNGNKLLKIKVEGSEAEGNDISECEAPDKITSKVWLCTICNEIKDANLEDIDYEYYIQKCNNIINSIDRGKVTKAPINKNQLSLF
jgi:hypothetical protein